MEKNEIYENIALRGDTFVYCHVCDNRMEITGIDKSTKGIQAWCKKCRTLVSFGLLSPDYHTYPKTIEDSIYEMLLIPDRQELSFD